MKTLPDRRGYFGDYGGRFVPETLMEPLAELEEALRRAKGSRDFERRFSELLGHYVGRPTPLYRARRLSARLGGAEIWLKREDLCHTGAHKINNAIGQALLARQMGKGRVIAETGAGQHGVAMATAAALLGLECRIYMGTEDMRRQASNVYRMRLLGAEVAAVDAGARTLKDAINEALRDWVTNVRDDPLRAGLGARAAPLPRDGARLPGGDRRRGPGAVPRARRPRSARDRGGVRRRGLQRHRDLLPPSSPTSRCAWWVSRRADAARAPASTPPAWPATDDRACSTAR